MGIMKLSSQITFLYFEKLDEARDFFDNILELDRVYDPKWSCVWRTGQDAFVGGVDSKEGSIEVKARGGVLVSFTVNNLEDVHEKLKKYNLSDMSDIKKVKELDLKSFFFTGPEGYKFEVQQFTSGELSELF